MPDSRKIAELQLDEHNANLGTDRGRKLLAESLHDLGAGRSILLDKEGRIIAGNKTVEGAREVGIEDVIIVRTTGDQLVAVQRDDLDLENGDGRARRLAYADNRIAEVDLEWDIEQVTKDIEAGVDIEGMFEGFEFPEPGREGLIDDDDVPEPEEAITKPGGLWVLGEHRLLCGDATKVEDVARLMDGEKAELLHADPPYGMGKEKDGVLNDNLYREKLDAFQMKWWKAFRPYIEDNGSAYIWGNAEDLWRLWYKGSLKDSERLTLRNELVWDKGHGQGMGAKEFRSYPIATERALFFMLGEQGFNNNADNYWNGWDFVVDYLKEEKEKSGLTIKDFKRIAGHSENSGCHWFDKSQWMMPTKETYQSWQKALNGDAFKRDYDDLKRDYDDLKRDFYSARAYFDNTHDNMTDAWQFERVIGEERHGHATPKPVGMICRVARSSSQQGALVAEPFLGSGSTLIACEKTNRRCYGMEIDPHYCDVIVNRWQQFTGKKAVREIDKNAAL